MLTNQRCVIATISHQASNRNRTRLVVEKGGVDMRTALDIWHCGGGSYTSHTGGHSGIRETCTDSLLSY